MIQYKSWNSYSPLSAEAAKWAMEHKHMFPVGNINLYQGEEASVDDVQIDLFDDAGEKIAEAARAAAVGGRAGKKTISRSPPTSLPG